MSTYIPRSKRTFALTLEVDFPLWHLLLLKFLYACERNGSPVVLECLIGVLKLSC
ncbi:hypothetical protein Hanom_Chr10g00951291 [Helianthus anomalus]